MGQASLITPNAFPEPARVRLRRFLEEKKLGTDKDILALTPDASTREYFRIPWKRRKAIVLSHTMEAAQGHRSRLSGAF
jgi:hypothetical protein